MDGGRRSPKLTALRVLPVSGRSLPELVLASAGLNDYWIGLVRRFIAWQIQKELEHHELRSQ
jgi:hypothetical protein